MPDLAAGRLAALVPCHRLPPAAGLLEAVREQVGSLLVVDDGMGAAEGAALDGLSAALGFEVLRLPSNRGKGHALSAGIGALRAARPSPAAVLTLDCDGQHPPETIPRFLAAATAGELVIGNRFADGGDGMPPLRHAGNRLSSRLLSLRTGAHVPDGQCGMRLLRGRALHAIDLPPGAMESETRHLVACLRAGVPVRWVPIPAIYEGHPTSFRRLRDSAAVMRAILAS